MAHDRSSSEGAGLDRREFVRTVSACGVAGVVLGVPAFAEDANTPTPPPRPETNIAEFMKVPRTRHSLPGPFPGKVVQVTDPRSLVDGTVNGAAIDSMFRRGLSALTGRDPAASFRLFFSRDDVVGIKVNPVGPPLINTRLELVDAVVKWLVESGLPPGRIVIWDRFDTMLAQAGFTAKRFPGLQIAGLQTMDEGGDKWKDASGRHVSEVNFDKDAFYFAKGIPGASALGEKQGYKTRDDYLNQHVFDGEYSYFGKLLTKKLTKIINVPVFKNTGNGISMATKNLGYGAICNTARLHTPLFFDVCTEVLAAPVIRDKLVLNITDGLRGQYDGGPMLNEAFVYPFHTLLLATDPFASDAVGQKLILEKRRQEGVKVNESPRFTEYLRYAERLKLGVVDPARLQHVRLTA